MNRRFFPNTTARSLLHCENVYCSKRCSASLNFTICKLSQKRNAHAPTVCTESGNTTYDNREHSSKAASPIRSTPAGISIRSISEEAKAFVPISTTRYVSLAYRMVAGIVIYPL